MKDINYCVYFHRRQTDNSVFYVGMGSPARAITRGVRNKDWFAVEESCGYYAQIIHINLPINIAYKIEKKYIKLFGRRDLGLGQLINRTDGGKGPCGLIHADEYREALSNRMKINNPMKEEHHRAQSSEWMRNRVVSQETRKKISDRAKGRDMTNVDYSKIPRGGDSKLAKKLINLDTGIIYSCAKNATDVLGISKSRLYKILKGKSKVKIRIAYL